MTLVCWTKQKKCLILQTLALLINQAQCEKIVPNLKSLDFNSSQYVCIGWWHFFLWSWNVTQFTNELKCKRKTWGADGASELELELLCHQKKRDSSFCPSKTKAHKGHVGHWAWFPIKQNCWACLKPILDSIDSHFLPPWYGSLFGPTKLLGEYITKNLLLLWSFVSFWFVEYISRKAVTKDAIMDTCCFSFESRSPFSSGHGVEKILAGISNVKLDLTFIDR